MSYNNGAVVGIYNNDGSASSSLMLMMLLMMMTMTCVIAASAPSSARLTPPAVYGRFGHPLEMNCVGSRHTLPPPRVSWFKDGVAVVISERHRVDNTRFLVSVIV